MEEGEVSAESSGLRGEKSRNKLLLRVEVELKALRRNDLVQCGVMKN